MDITDKFEVATVKVCNYLRNNPGSKIILRTDPYERLFKFSSDKSNFEVHFSNVDINISDSLAGRMVRSHGMGFVVNLLNHRHEISVIDIRNCNLCMIREVMNA